MIKWGDVYNVIEAMTPLYVALGLGYGSVRWWHVFSPEQCAAINRLVSLFTIPLYNFEFTSHVNPFTANYRLLAADVISKVVIISVLVVWAKFSSKKGSYCWSITCFSLSTLSNTLIVGVPLLKAMYGPIAQDMVVQISVVQTVLWFTALLFALEFRDARMEVDVGGDNCENGKGSEANNDSLNRKRPSFGSVLKVVGMKLAVNPNIYSSVVAVAWAFVSNRWHIEMPKIIHKSIQIMSNAGSGMAMFSMGNFMASQEKLIACGPNLALFGMVLRFIAGPAAMAAASAAVGLHSTVLHVAIIQAALPQSIASFIYAREYGLHPEVLSTAVIFGTLVCLPVMIAYYVTLELLR